MRHALVSLIVLIAAGCAPLTGGGVFRSPDFTALDVRRGEPVKLSSCAGGHVLLHFWASWCVQCVPELRSLEQLHSRLRDRGFTVVAVAVDDIPERVMKVAERERLSFPVWIDVEGASKELYGVTALPLTVFLDPQGERLKLADPESGETVHYVDGPRYWGMPRATAYFEHRLTGN